MNSERIQPHFGTGATFAQRFDLQRLCQAFALQVETLQERCTCTVTIDIVLYSFIQVPKCLSVMICTLYSFVMLS